MVVCCGRSPDNHRHCREGMRHPLYQTWVNMNKRCSNPGDREYGNYGGRGITVCACWRMSFETFLEDMGERPGGPRGSADHHSLDRIDNDGNYEPSNCRWATALEQIHNRRPSRSW